ncbi:MAG: polymer-forming cytoskeletal protein [Pseudomonadota bacterium]
MMTPGYLTYFAFALVCLLLLTLPFVPAFKEWLYPTDSGALPISSIYTSDIDHFARRLDADARARLGTGPATGFEDFELMAHPAGVADLRDARKRMISPDIQSAEALHSAQPLYVNGSIHAGAGSVFSALYATGSVALGAESEIRDWGHADGVLVLNNNSVAMRRISAGMAVELGNETWFERVQAPVVHFGSGRAPAASYSQEGLEESGYGDLPDAVMQTPLLCIVRGNCSLPARRIYRGSLVVTGFLIVGPGTTVVGDIKAREGISIARGAQVLGAVTCEKRVYMFNDSSVSGPLVSEADILIGANAVIGQPDAPTTISARNIIVEDGVVAHGAVWAHEIGMVKAA